MLYRFESNLPGRILCCDGAAGRVGRALDAWGCDKVLLVTDRGGLEEVAADALADRSMMMSPAEATAGDLVEMFSRAL